MTINNVYLESKLKCKTLFSDDKTVNTNKSIIGVKGDSNLNPGIQSPPLNITIKLAPKNNNIKDI